MNETLTDVYTALETARTSRRWEGLTLQGLVPEFIAARLGDVANQEQQVEGALELRRLAEVRDHAATEAELEGTPLSEQEYRLVKSALAVAAHAAGREVDQLRALEALVRDAVNLWEGPMVDLVASVRAHIPAGAPATRTRLLADLVTSAEVEDCEGHQMSAAERRVHAAKLAHDELTKADEAARQARARRNARVILAAEAGAVSYRISQALGVQPSTISRILPAATGTR